MEFDDLVIVAQHYGQYSHTTGVPLFDWAGGCFDYDSLGSVGFSSLINVAENYGQTSGAQVRGFASGGLFTLGLGDPTGWGDGVVVLPSGNVLIAGGTYDDDGHAEIAVIELNPDGTLDTSFNSVGYVVTQINGFSGATSISLDSAGIGEECRFSLPERPGRTGTLPSPSPRTRRPLHDREVNPQAKPAPRSPSRKRTR